MTLFKKTMLATALAATALAGATPAMADGYRGGGYHHGGDGAGLAIGAGILGLAVGAIIASNSHHDDRYDRRYADNGYPNGGYYATPYAQPHWVWHDGYYWDHDGNRYGRDGRYYGQYRPDRNWHDRDDGDRYDGYRGY